MARSAALEAADPAVESLAASTYPVRVAVPRVWASTRAQAVTRDPAPVRSTRPHLAAARTEQARQVQRAPLAQEAQPALSARTARLAQRTQRPQLEKRAPPPALPKRQLLPQPYLPPQASGDAYPPSESSGKR